MNIINSTKRNLIGKANTLIFVAAIIGSVSLSIAVVTAKFMLDQHSFNTRVMKEKKLAKSNLESNVKQLDALKNNLNALEQTSYNSKTILEALPSKYDFPAVGSSIEYIASNSGQDMTAFRFSGTDLGDTQAFSSTAPVPFPMPFETKVNGAFAKTFTFLKDMERSIRPIRVTTLQLKGQEGNNVEAGITAETYYQPTKDLKVTTKEIK